ncbi:MAG: HK97 family phage prohead protease [Gammaproteobacteria bacterium]|nr:MAG: HK97 family phage prohead protease [Gammaproteobacteria bacterium]
MDLERRHFPGADGVSLRAMEDDGQRKLVGTFAPFRSRSQLLGGQFYEIIEPGAFDAVLGDDVRALFNHDPNNLLGRSTNGTLRMWTEDDGARYEVDLDETDVAERVLAGVRRRDITGNSFAFQLSGDEADEEWRSEGGVMIRRIKRFSRLLDVGPVTYPAYEATQVSARSLEMASDHTGVDVRKLWKRHWNLVRRQRMLDTR